MLPRQMLPSCCPDAAQMTKITCPMCWSKLAIPCCRAALGAQHDTALLRASKPEEPTSCSCPMCWSRLAISFRAGHHVAQHQQLDISNKACSKLKQQLTSCSCPTCWSRLAASGRPKTLPPAADPPHVLSLHDTALPIDGCRIQQGPPPAAGPSARPGRHSPSAGHLVAYQLPAAARGLDPS